MKKLSLIALASLFATSAFAVAVTVPASGNTRSNPQDWTGVNYAIGEQLAWQGALGVSPSTTTLGNFYFRINTVGKSASQFITSGTRGWHQNAHFLFTGLGAGDGSDSSLTFTSDKPIDFNGTGYAMEYYLEAENAGNKGIVNFTNAAAGINMSSTDQDNGGNVFGTFGRKFYLGEGITIKAAGNLAVSGYTTSTTEKPSRGSLFSISGTIETKTTAAGTFSVTDSHAEILSTGKVDTRKFLLANTANTYFNLYGNITATTEARITGGIMDIYSGASITTPSFILAGGGINVHDNFSTTNLSTVASTATIDVAAGKTYTAGTITNPGALVINSGNVVATKMTSVGALTINSGASLTLGDNTLANNTNFSTGATAPTTVYGNLLIKSYIANGHAGNTYLGSMTVDGGTVTENTTSDAVYVLQSGQGKTLELKNGGTIKVTGSTTGNVNSAYLTLLNSTVKADATSHIDVKNVAFATYNNNTLDIAKASVFTHGINEFLVKDSVGDNKVILGGGDTYNIARLAFLRNSDITFKLNGCELVFTKIEGFKAPDSSNTDHLIFKDFTNRSVKVGNWNSDVIASGTFVIAENGEYVQTLVLTAYDENGELIEGDWSIVDGYLFNSGLIPEPAEWAAIFGALALGFAIYRRRLLKR